MNVTTRIHDLLPTNPYVFEVIIINEGMCLEYVREFITFFHILFHLDDDKPPIHDDRCILHGLPFH